MMELLSYGTQFAVLFGAMVALRNGKAADFWIAFFLYQLGVYNERIFPGSRAILPDSRAGLGELWIWVSMDLALLAIAMRRDDK